MSENNKPMEMSADELEAIAGGAAAVTDAANTVFEDSQVQATALGANGGISNLTAQDTRLSQQKLEQIQVTGNLPKIPEIF